MIAKRLNRRFGATDVASGNPLLAQYNNESKTNKAIKVVNEAVKLDRRELPPMGKWLTRLDCNAVLQSAIKHRPYALRNPTALQTCANPMQVSPSTTDANRMQVGPQDQCANPM